MATTLAYGATTISMPDDFVWEDEFGWKPVEQRTRYTVTGALRLDSVAKQAGRRIVLGGEVWLTRTVLGALYDASLLAGQQFTLTYRGVAHTVVFDHEAGAIEAPPVVDYADPDPSDSHIVRLRFIKV